MVHNTKLLNTIILILFFGITAVILRNSFTTKEVQRENKPTAMLSPTGSTPLKATDVPTSKPVSCNHPFFNFAVGSSWTYEIDTTSTEDMSGGKTQKNQTIFTSTIIEASASAVLITTTSKDSKTSNTQSITCKVNGVYGFPMPLIQTGDESIGHMFDSFLLIGNDIKKGAFWKSNISLDMLPIMGQDMSLKSTVRDVSEGGNKAIITTEMEIGEALGKSVVDFQTDILTYSLEKGVGITDFLFTFKTGNITVYSSKGTLVSSDLK